MNSINFITTFLVDQTSSHVFAAIKNVRGWWSGLHDEKIEGNTAKLNDEFTFHAGGGQHYSKQKLVELVPDEKIVWLVTDSKLTFLEKENEWTGTKICFDISTQDNKTKIVFTHDGLTPDIECYNGCSTAWGQYLHNFNLRFSAGNN